MRARVARNVSKADRELFRRAMADVRRLRSDEMPTQTPTVPAARRSSARKAVPSTTITTREPAARRDKAEIGALRRGRLTVEATLDLHGSTTEAARMRLREFIAEALSESLRCVRIVHGKGLRSGPAGPVLKTLVERELQASENVVAFVPARPADGGSGAAVALLRPGRQRTTRRR